ncbi:MAG TPA: hypothetical protein VN376_05365 [Longilinea sp.]|nr:hypothetical protein [Longilinea sp.]
MTHHAVFEGLVIDENDQPVSVKMVGEEPCYVVNDGGFLRHIPARDVDRQVMDFMAQQVEGNEDLIAEQTAKMLGQEDPFSRAIIENQLKNMGDQFDALLNTGIPESGRAYLGMMGFKVVINVHGEVVRVDQPTQAGGKDGEEGE